MKAKHLPLILVASIFFVNIAFAQIPTNGLMGYYPFSGNANDMSGNLQNGTVNGATLATDRFGNANCAYNFNGISNYISLLPSTNYIGLNSYTYSLWIKPTAIPTNGGGIIYGVGEATGNGIEQALTYQPATSLYAGCHNIGTNPFQSSSQSSPMAINQWIHVVVARDSFNVKMYVNQNLIAITSNSASNNQPANYGSGTKNAIIGGRCNLNSAYFYTGVIDDIRIYNRTVTQIEVNALYEEGLCYETISVTDTLVINGAITGINPVVYNNSIKIYPNPTKDHIIIDNGNFGLYAGYTVKITNSLGQIVFTSLVNQQQFSVDLSTWSGNGIYFVHIIDAQSNTLDIRKIVLQ